MVERIFPSFCHTSNTNADINADINAYINASYPFRIIDIELKGGLNRK